MQESELWKPVVGYAGMYEVSSDGQVRSVPRFVKTKNGSKRRVPGGMRKQATSKGYKRIRLSRRGKYSYCAVHRLVAEAFLPKADSSAGQVNHKDGVKSNNKVSNLEWVTPSENTIHALHVLGNPSVRGEAIGSSILTEYEVRKIRSLYRQSSIFQRELADRFGVHIMTINDILKGRTWTHIS